jgi:hypothetical protein
MLRSEKLTVDDCEVFREALKLEREGQLLSIIDEIICDFAAKIAQPNFWDRTERGFMLKEHTAPVHAISGVVVDISPPGSEISRAPSESNEPDDDKVLATIRKAVALSRQVGPFQEFQVIAEHPILDEEASGRDGLRIPLARTRGTIEL